MEDTLIFSKSTVNPFIYIHIEGVQPWTSETPNLYTLILQLKDPKGAVTDIRTCKVGF
jgi:beta-galactosidase